MCKYGASAYKNQAIEPTGATPLSGNVVVTMEFLIDA
jgi:hypothetical protein